MGWVELRQNARPATRRFLKLAVKGQSRWKNAPSGLTHCRIDAAKLLLDKGAKIDAKAAGGTTALHLAAQSGCLDLVNLLLSKGAKVNARDDQGRTPLDRAMLWHRDEVVQLLRAHGGTE